ncbi:uncharacterized protein LOC122298964 [Carya illinoinensis]|uniref:uncharacterized protein LOC122298964 n=1 Tax=Carya illinoinensis TaxID=32201 RepID=UPI001C71FA6C|nr:uncharacterized protein LOC122298964 [Carya illinoinensis]
MVKLANKLKALKAVLRRWNKEVFGWTSSHIQGLEERIASLEEQLQLGFFEDVELDLLASKVELHTWMSREETRLAQQAKQRWLEKGEGNSQFFHALSSRSHRVVREMEIDIKAAVFSIPIDSSLGSDGFGSGFYKFCWEILAKDVVTAIHDFFRVGWLAPLLPQIVSQEQGAFTPGRSILENISLTQEMVLSINKKVRGGNVVLKIDMAKAYDSVDWKFLIQVLAAFGFSELACSLVWRRALLNCMGFSEDTLPFKYLEVPIIAGRLKAIHLEELVGKIRKKIGG